MAGCAIAACSGEATKVWLRCGYFLFTENDEPSATAPEPYCSTAYLVGTDPEAILVEQSALGVDTGAPRHWETFERRDDLFARALQSHPAGILISIHAKTETLALARDLHGLQHQCNGHMKIILRDFTPDLGCAARKLLAACGVLLIVPREVPLSRLYNLLDAVWRCPPPDILSDNFPNLTAHLHPPSVRGVVDIETFRQLITDTCRNDKNSADHSLLRLTPRGHLDAAQCLSRMHFQHDGNCACVIGSEVYLFLFGCEETDTDAELERICELPWPDLFMGKTRLENLPDSSDISLTNDSINPPISSSAPPDARSLLQPKAIDLSLMATST
jgi:Protein of unknown function (DUF2819).